VKLSGDKETKLSITIEAFEPAASYIHQTIKEDLEYFGKGV
jgi:hypothetical protein